MVKSNLFNRIFFLLVTLLVMSGNVWGNTITLTSVNGKNVFAADDYGLFYLASTNYNFEKSSSIFNFTSKMGKGTESCSFHWQEVAPEKYTVKVTKISLSLRGYVATGLYNYYHPINAILNGVDKGQVGVNGSGGYSSISESNATGFTSGVPLVLSQQSRADNCWWYFKDIIITYTATPRTYTVSFDLNGGSSTTPSSMQVTYDQAYGTLPSAPTHATKLFKGWYLVKEGGDPVTASTIVQTASNHTLYAQWEEVKTRAVGYVTNKDTHEGGKLYISSTAMSIANVPSWLDADSSGINTGKTHTYYYFAKANTGWDFTGWKNTSGSIVSTATTFTPTITVNTIAEGSPNPKREIYNAIFTVHKWTLTWAGLTGATVSGGTPAGTTNYGTALTAPTVSKAGWAFTGWNPSVPATMPDNNATYTAQWAAVTVSGATAKSVSFTGQTETKTATLEFPVTNASSTNDFNTPAVSGDAGWTVKSWSYASNKVSVVMTFTATENTTTSGNHVATVTLKAKSNNQATGTVTATVNLTPTYTCNLANSYKVNASSINLNSLWTSSSNGAKTYTCVFTPDAKSHEGYTTPTRIESDGVTLTFGQAGTAKLTLTQAAGTSSKASSATKTITIVRNDRGAFIWNEPNIYYYNSTYNNYVSRGSTDKPLTGTSTNSNVATITASGSTLNVTTYNVPGSATLTVSQPETYYYNAKSETKTVTPQKVANHVTFNYNEGLFKLYSSVKSDVAKTEWVNKENPLDSYLRIGNNSGGGGNFSDKWFDIHLTGIPDSLFFRVSCANSSASSVEWYVATSYNNDNYKVIWTSDFKDGTSWSPIYALPLDSNVTDIRMCYSGNFAGDINVRTVTEKVRFSATPTTINFGEVQSSASATYTKNFTFAHANAGYNVVASSNDAHFTVNSAVGAGQTGGDRMGYVPVTVTYHPTDVNTHNGTITLTDQLGHQTQVQVSGTALDKLKNTIVTTMDGETAYSHTAWPNTSFQLVATANNTDYANHEIVVTRYQTGGNTNCYTTYSKIDNHTGTFTTNINQYGTDTFKLTQTASDTYAAAEQYITVVVAPAPASGCYVLYDMDKHQMKKDDWYERSWSGTNVAGTLTLQTKSDYDNTKITPYQVVNGQDIAMDPIKNYGDWQTFTYNLNPAATGIKIHSVTGTHNYIQAITVSRNTYLEVPTQVTCPERLISTAATTATFDVAYSSCGNRTVTLVCDNDKFTLSPSSFDVADGTSGTRQITVTYMSGEVGDHVANVTVNDQSYTKIVALSGRTYSKITPTITIGEGGHDMYITRDTMNPSYHDIAYFVREQCAIDNPENPSVSITLENVPAGVTSADYRFLSDKRFYSTKLGTYVFRVSYGETTHYSAASATFNINVLRFTPTIYWYLNGEEYIDGTYLIGDGHPAVQHGDTLKVACVADITSYSVDKTQYANIERVKDESERYNGYAAIISPSTEDVTITLTATSALTNYYESVTVTKSFIVTRKKRQVIEWDDDLSSLTTLYDRDASGAFTGDPKPQTFTLTGVSYDDEGIPTNKTITYTITPDASIVPTPTKPSEWNIATGSGTPGISTFGYTNKGAGFIITATQNDQTDYAPAAPITKRLNVYDYHDGCGKEVTILDPATTEGKIIDDDNYRVYNLSMPASLSFTIRKYYDGAWLYNENRPMMVDFYDGPVEGSETGGHCTGNLILSKTYSPNEIPTKNLDPATYTIDGISELARSVYFHTPSAYGFHLFSVDYLKQQYARPTTDKISILAYSSQPSDPAKFSVMWSNCEVFVECTNKRCIVTPNTFGGCGAQGVARLSVVYNAPALPTVETGEIILRDQTGNALATIPLTAQVNYGAAQHITSLNVKPSYHTIDSVVLKATSDREPEVKEFTYSVSGDPGVAYITTNKDGASVLKFYRSGVISVTAYQAGTQDIAPAYYTVDNVVIEKTPLIDLIPPVASSIDYGQKMQEATLSGGSAALPDQLNVSAANAACPGEYQWERPNEKHAANYGNPQLLPVVYYPAHEVIDFITGETVYYDERYAATEAETNLIINRVQPTLTWTDASPVTIPRGSQMNLNVQVKAETAASNEVYYLQPVMSTSGTEQLARFDYTKQSNGTYKVTMHALREGTAQLTASYPASQNFHAATPITKTLQVESSNFLAWTVNDSTKFNANTNINFSDLILGASDISITAGGIAVGDTIHVLSDYVEVDNENKMITFKAPTPYYLTLTASATGYENKVLHFLVVENEQYILWNQDFFDNYYDGGTFAYNDTILNAMAVDKDGNPTNQSITYKISDATIAEIIFVDSKPVLHFKKEGVTTITATAAEGGSSYYTPASATTRICIYYEGFKCGLNLYKGSESLIGTTIGDEGVSVTWDQENVADQLTFKGALTVNASENKWIIINYRTKIGTDGENDVWTKTDSVYVIGQWREFTLDIPSNATGVKFTNPVGTTWPRAVNAITITRHRYFYLTEDSIKVNHLGVKVVLERTFDVRYSANPLIKFGLKNGDKLVTTSSTGLTITPNRLIDNDCDYAGSYTFTLSAVWTTPQEIYDTAVIYNAAGETYYVPIYIHVEKGKRFIFDRPEGGVWSQSTNWAMSDGKTKDYFHGLVPGISDSVEIQSRLEIAEPTDVYGMSITGNGQVFIGPQGGLNVWEGGITGATADNLIIQSTLSAQGFFRMHPEAVDPKDNTKPCQMPNATVEFATRGTLETGNDRDATWQYTGVPSPQTGAVLPYSAEWEWWSEQDGWVTRNGKTDSILPFQGYATAPYGYETFRWRGQLINADKTISLTYTESGMQGANVFANSYASPIDLKQFTNDDFEGTDATLDKVFYIYNTGSWNQWQASGDTTVGSISYVAGGNSTPGHYTAIPVLAAKDLDESIDLTMIASLEGVYVQCYGPGAAIHLDYEKHVWNASSTYNQMNYPARAPQRDIEPIDNLNRVRLQVNSSTSGADYIYVLERPEYSTGYDNGYDAPKVLPDAGQQTTVYLYTNESYGVNEVSATSDADGMYIGFLSSEDELYTLTARAVQGTPYYLLDTETGIYTYLTDSAQYSFAAKPNTTYAHRFRLVKQTPAVPTELEEETSSWSEGPIRVYTVTGQYITTTYSVAGLQALPTGVYLVQLKNSTTKFVKK